MLGEVTTSSHQLFFFFFFFVREEQKRDARSSFKVFVRALRRDKFGGAGARVRREEGEREREEEQMQQLRTILPRAAGAVLRENDGTDFNTNRGLFGVLFSLEDVCSVDSEADDGTRGDFERGDGTNRGGLGDVFRAQRRADVGVREYLLELRVVDFFAGEEHSPVARGRGRERK
jgi:hypothetical protein